MIIILLLIVLLVVVCVLVGWREVKNNVSSTPQPTQTVIYYIGSVCNAVDGCMNDDLDCVGGICLKKLGVACTTVDECTQDAVACTQVCTNVAGNPGYSCSQNSDCNIGSVCVNRQCYVSVGGACELDYMCNDSYCSNNVCTAYTANGSTCDSGRECLSGNCSNSVCQPQGVITGTLGSACDNSVECGTGLICNNSVCTQAVTTFPSYETCTSSLGCLANTECDNGICKMQNCSVNGCIQGFVCQVEDNCYPVLGVPGVSNSVFSWEYPVWNDKSIVLDSTSQISILNNYIIPTSSNIAGTLSVTPGSNTLTFAFLVKVYHIGTGDNNITVNVNIDNGIYIVNNADVHLYSSLRINLIEASDDGNVHLSLFGGLNCLKSNNTIDSLGAISFPLQFSTSQISNNSVDITIDSLIASYNHQTYSSCPIKCTNAGHEYVYNSYPLVGPASSVWYTRISGIPTYNGYRVAASNDGTAVKIYAMQGDINTLTQTSTHTNIATVSASLNHVFPVSAVHYYLPGVSDEYIGCIGTAGNSVVSKINGITSTIFTANDPIANLALSYTQGANVLQMKITAVDSNGVIYLYQYGNLNIIPGRASSTCFENSTGILYAQGTVISAAVQE